MVVNVPVRLVRKDGGLIPLDVTELVLDVDRGVNARSTLFGGARRYAMDLNRPKAVILLKGYIVDDDLSGITVGQTASGTIDFSTRNLWPTGTTSLVGDGVGADLTSLAESMAHNDFTNPDNPVLTLRASDGESYDIHFIKSSTAQGYNTASSGKYHVSIHDNSNMNTAAEIANNLVSLINSTATAENVLINNRFNASAVVSPITGETATVLLAQKVAGEDGNKTISWDAFSTHTPVINSFAGGQSTSGSFTSMSAGDKVAHLYAILNNSNDGGFKFTTAEKYGKDPAIRGLNAASRYATGNKHGVRQKYADYIGGIQIPFNSTINNDSGDKYVAKNFFMPTGRVKRAKDKHPNQALPASTEIENTNDSTEYSFIKGAVTKATFVQMGGEPIYAFDIQFLPIDSIL